MSAIGAVRRDGPWLVSASAVGEVRVLSDRDTELSGFVDVHVLLTDGQQLVATFGTVADVLNAMSRWQGTSECLGGRYCWVADLVIVDVADVPTIVATIEDLSSHGELHGAFSDAHDDEQVADRHKG